MLRRFFRTLAPSLQGRLSLLLVAVLCPGAVLAGVLIYLGYGHERQAVERHLQSTAAALSALMESELREREALLKGLAASPFLQTADFAAFRQQALQTVAGRDEWIVLTDASDQQLVNTAIAQDAPLPVVPRLPEFRAAIEGGRTYISNLTIGAATGRQVLFVTVPVLENGKLRYAVTVTMTPQVFTQSLLSHKIGEGWLISVVDREMSVAGRNRGASSFVGKKASPGMAAILAAQSEGIRETVTLDGVASISAFYRSPRSGWTVVVAAPQAELFARAQMLVLAALVLSLAVGACAILGAFWVGRSVISGIHALVTDTGALAQGQPLKERVSGINELDFVSKALAKTSGILAARESALAHARDQALAASRAKDDFLAALSHELRTPLNPVLLLASDGARDESHPAAVRETFGVIARNIAIEARLIEDLLDLTRISSGKLSLHLHSVEIDRVLLDTIQTLQRPIDEKPLTLAVDLQAADALVTGDSTRLQQVFWNLLNNAIKFTPPHGRIDLRSRCDHDSGEIVIEVSDSGLGMTVGEIGRIFQRFSQGDHATTNGQSGYGGLGLGLVITRNLVEMHQGRINATSAGRGQGATFTVRLPLSRQPSVFGKRPVGTEALGEITLSESPVKPSTSSRARKILLVEDHKPTLATLEMLLKRRGYEIATASTAESALHEASLTTFDLVISDVGLPDRTGHELMRELHSRYRLKGIAITGYGSEADLARGKAAGFLLHLTKPVSVSSMEDALREVFVTEERDSSNAAPAIS